MLAKKNSDIHLRPRFKMNFNVADDFLIEKFRNNLKQETCEYCSKIVDNHIIIDVPKKENSFWSPQLNIEIEKTVENVTVVRGLFGPKPQVWTLFMFFHFAIAVAFIGFAVMAYVQWSLKIENALAVNVIIGLPILWVIMYFLGRLGRSRGNKQMDDLYQFMMHTLNE